jgi:protein-tyrosine phosphatase
MAGIFPVLAHPERNADFERDPDLIHQFRDAGVPCQVTAMSLAGEFGRRARKVSERWLAEGSVDLIASDGHSARGRPPTLDAAARVVRKHGGPTLEDWLTREVPRRILAGEAVLG